MLNNYSTINLTRIKTNQQTNDKTKRNERRNKPVQKQLKPDAFSGRFYTLLPKVLKVPVEGFKPSARGFKTFEPFFRN